MDTESTRIKSTKNSRASKREAKVIHVHTRIDKLPGIDSTKNSRASKREARVIYIHTRETKVIYIHTSEASVIYIHTSVSKLLLGKDNKCMNGPYQ